MGQISGGMGTAITDFRRLLDGDSVVGLGDGALLMRFNTIRDPVAFEALVARHAAMVLGVCRRILRDSHEVDDAFQATFLVLVRRAPSIRNGDMLGPWLHGVATRVARRAQNGSYRRAVRERIAVYPEPQENSAALDPDSAELRALIDEEIDRLPEHHRRPVVLCDVEGLSREEAAQRLGWSLNMVRGRLERARGRLRDRLTRRGLSPSGTGLALLAAPPIPSAMLIGATSRAALAFAAGRLDVGLISASTLTLYRGVLRMMLLSRWKLVGVSTLATGTMLVTLAVPGLARTGPQSGAATPPRVSEKTERLDPTTPKPNLDIAPPLVTVRVSGVIRDLQGHPVPGAKVIAVGTQMLTDPKFTIKTAEMSSTVTGVDGFYLLPAVAVPTSRYHNAPIASTPFIQYGVLATAPGFGLSWHRDESMYAIATPDPTDIQRRKPLGSATVMDVTLRPETALKGRVIDESGKPIAGVKVRVVDVCILDDRGTESSHRISMQSNEWPENFGRVTTDDEGRFRIPGLPSECCCWLFFDRPGFRVTKGIYASTSAEVETTHGWPDSPNGRRPHAVLPKDMTVSMLSTRKVEVRVVADDDSKPISGAEVNVKGEIPKTGAISLADADEEGRVALELPSGLYSELIATPPSSGSRFIRTSLQPFIVSSEPLVQQVEVRMQVGCELLLKAVDATTGLGVSGIRFEIQPAAMDEPWIPLPMSTFYTTGDESTPPTGRLRAVLAPVPGKAYRIRVLGTGQIPPQRNSKIPPALSAPGDFPPSIDLPYNVLPAISEPFAMVAGKTVRLQFQLQAK